MFGSFTDSQGSFANVCGSLSRICRAPLALACGVCLQSRFIHAMHMCVCVKKHTHTPKICQFTFLCGVSWTHMLGSFADLQGSFPDVRRSRLRIYRAPLALVCGVPLPSRFIHTMHMCACVKKHAHTPKISQVTFPCGVSWTHMFGSFADIQGSFPEACRSLLRICSAPLALASRVSPHSRCTHDICRCVCVCVKTHTHPKKYVISYFLAESFKLTYLALL